MGAGCSQARKYKIIYSELQKLRRKLAALGIASEYKNRELRGEKFVAYFCILGPASNGESFGFQVLRVNETQRPDACRKVPGDIEYTDFHRRDNPANTFDAGIEWLRRDCARPQVPVDLN